MSALFLDVTFSLLKTLDWIIIIRLATQYIKYADSARLKPLLSLSSSSFVRRVGFWYIRWKIIKLLWKLVCVKKHFGVFCTVVFYQIESVRSKWELPMLPPSSLEVWRKKRAKLQLLSWWNALNLIGHCCSIPQITLPL